MRNRKLLFILFVFGNITLPAQPFKCSGDFILTVSQDADSSMFYTIDVDDDNGSIITFAALSETPGPYLNAIGYRRTDNYVYGIAPNTRDLYRLDASGNTTFLRHLEEFQFSKNYNAGAVSPDGKYLVVLGGISSSPPWRSVDLILIDLESPGYEVTTKPLITLSGEVVYSLDIAFDPISGDLYGYDGNQGRLLKIQLSSGEVDDLSFPSSGTINAMAALFFDAFGNLYGYAKHLDQQGIKAFYAIDKTNGSLDFMLEGPLASGSDGCSCPYRVELLKTVSPLETSTCSEVEYTFEVANSSNTTQPAVIFKDVFPEGFEVLEVTGNTYGGQVSGLNSSTLTISNMEIVPGVDSFKVKVAIGNVSTGIYNNQAILTNISSLMGGLELSDDPGTAALNDSTALYVEALNLEIEDQFLQICPGDTIELDATLPDGLFDYLWNDGQTNPIISVSEGGFYQVEASNACETFLINFEVEAVSPDFTLELGANRSIQLGDHLLIQPNISGGTGLTYLWSDAYSEGVLCTTCPTLELAPTIDNQYALMVTDQNGCSISDTINIRVIKDYKVFVPNVFSVNFDGLNDWFYVQGGNGIIVKKLEVFNRWGGLVFSNKEQPANQFQSGWDGQIKGKTAAAGVYTWKAVIEFADGHQQIFVGDVTLVN